MAEKNTSSERHSDCKYKNIRPRAFCHMVFHLVSWKHEVPWEFACASRMHAKNHLARTSLREFAHNATAFSKGCKVLIGRARATPFSAEGTEEMNTKRHKHTHTHIQFFVGFATENTSSTFRREHTLL